MHTYTATFPRKVSPAEGTENGPLGLCSGRVWDHPSSGKNQGKLRANQPQLAPAQNYEQKRKSRTPRFVLYNQAVIGTHHIQNMLPIRLYQSVQLFHLKSQLFVTILTGHVVRRRLFREPRSRVQARLDARVPSQCPAKYTSFMRCAHILANPTTAISRSSGFENVRLVYPSPIILWYQWLARCMA